MRNGDNGRGNYAGSACKTRRREILRLSNATPLNASAAPPAAISRSKPIPLSGRLDRDLSSCGVNRGRRSEVWLVIKRWRGYANWRTGHLANYTPRGLDKSRTGQLADAAGDFACLVFVLLAESARPRVVQFATCPVRELAIRELSCYRVCMSAAVEPLWARCSHPCTACPGANIAKSSATGKVTVGLLSHWPCVTDFTGLSTDMLGEEDMFICSVYDFSNCDNNTFLQFVPNILYRIS